MNIPQQLQISQSAPKGGGSGQPTAPIGPISQNPILLNNPISGGAPLSQQLPNASYGAPAPPPGPGLLGQPASPQGAQAAQLAGGNAQAAMQAAMQGRPVAPSLPAMSGPGLLGPQGAGMPAGAPQGGSPNIGQMLKNLDPQTVQKLAKLFV